MYRFIFASNLLALVMAMIAAAKENGDTPKAASTRKKLQQKITVDYVDEPLRGVVEDLKEKIGSVGIRIDSKGGVSANIKITYKGNDQPLTEIFEGMFKKNGLGYIVISKQGDAYDGNILIKQGPERGYEKGQEPDTAAKPGSDKTGTGKPGAKDKTTSKEKITEKEKAPPKEEGKDDADKAEQDATRKLNFAKTFIGDGKTAKAKERLEEIVTKYPKTKAADEARQLLKKLTK